MQSTLLNGTKPSMMIRKTAGERQYGVVESKPDATVTALERILEQLGRLEVRQALCESQLSKQSRTESRNPRRNDSRRPRSELTCFGCGEKGHFVSQCPTNSNANPGNRQVAWGNNQPSNWRAKVWWIQKGLKNYIMESNHRCLRIVVVHLNVIQQFCFQTGNHLPASKILISENYRMTMTLDPMLLKQVNDPVLKRMEFLTQGQVGGIPINFLVDTGAAVTVMSTTTYERIPQNRRPALRQTHTKISGVGWTSVHVAGSAEMTLVFDGIPVDHEVLIVGIAMDAILGQDILLAHQCKLDLCSLTLKLRGRTLSCWTPGETTLACRVLIKGEVTIPSWSKRVIEVDIANAGYLAMNGLIQPTPEVIADKEISSWCLESFLPEFPQSMLGW